MALGFYFSPSGFTPENYDEAIRRLEEAGAGAPEGRSNHFALETNGEIQVFDVWESQEAFEAFGRRSFRSWPNSKPIRASRWSPGSTT